VELDYRNGMLELYPPDNLENKTAIAGIIGVMECGVKGVLMCSPFQSFRGFRGFRGRFKKKQFSGEIN
jgi:hypothetical protein